ncbi:MBOAT, membrane-bound O-acyltransferase family-domain-containing protein [Lactarius akahatsu]|uniref:MBOAT, membrane-bound O-acyltransferase family-domain-containing protein n=1 Tax=Lactarius akahatsu TaxID=416441 RepID=A0AAD4LT29_9AGAM|nr:MBOAT, membrane-bound O-acyltransferase family-domain-containing protein [Lactarius akahatsu]
MSLDFFFVPLAAKAGASLDQVKLITCLLASYPLGNLFVKIPSTQPTLKHLFSVAVASFYFVPVLNQGWPFLLLLGDVLATYFIALTVQGPRMPWIVFCFMMGHLFFNHIDRALHGDPFDGSYNITGPQMVLVMKLTTFAWNTWDGRRPVGDLDKWQTKMRVAKFPSLLEFLGFSLYFPGILVGPYLEYATYRSLIDGTLFDDATNKSGPRGRPLPDGRKRTAYRKMLLALGFLGIFMGVAPKISFQTAVTDWFLEQSLLYKILVLQLAGFVERSKYYGVWTLTEGASILTGLGFTGYTPSGVATWNGAANVEVLKIEVPENFKVLVDSWNIKTNVWLRECVYKRVTPKGQKAGFQSSMLTYLTSAIWHGVSAGYYLTFLLGGFITTVARLTRSTVRPLVLPPVSGPTDSKAANGNDTKQSTPPPTLIKTAYDVAGTVCTVLVVNFACTPFILLHLSDAVEAWRRLHWYGLWMVFGSMAFFYSGGTAWLKGIQAKRVRHVNAAAVSTSGPGTPGVAPTVPPVDVVFREAENKLSL